MHLTSFFTLFAAATILGAPTEPIEPTGITSLAADVLDQGDGFYLASYNEAGVLDVAFTPIAKLETTSPAAQLTTRATHTLGKRETVCSGRSSVALGTLDDANRQLASNAAAQGNYGKSSWGWVHRDAETSYFCNYQANFLTYQLIIDMHTVISGRCTQAGYGYDRRTNGGGAQDLSVGRTWRGDNFCDGNYHG